MKTFIKSLIFSILLTSCVSIQREPAALESATPVQSLADWEKALVEYAGFIRSSAFSPANCAVVFKAVDLKVQSLEFNLYSNEDLSQQASHLISALWQLRLQLHHRLPDVSADCRLRARDIFHHLHDQDDYLGEFAFKEPALEPAKIDFQKQAIPIYDRQAYPPYNVRADVDDTKFQFHSGDLMLARGVSFFSAMISQVSDNKSQFSHVVFVNEEPTTHKLNTVESYIGQGVDKYEMDFALKNENVRLLVLRPKDHALGEQASGYAMEAARDHVPYDYNMNFKDYSKQSCAEVARAAYDKASNGKVLLPLQPAKLNLHSDEFLQQINLKNGDLITPDDFEVDTRFELVLDWRDARLIRDSREKDAILSEMVRWIDQKGYKFHDTPKSFLAKNVILPLRKTRLWPMVKKLTKSPDLDPLLPKSTLGVMLVLNQLGQNLLEKVKEQDAQYFTKHQRPMTNTQLRDYLEQLRVDDLENFKEGDPSLIHEFLRPDNVIAKPPHREVN